KRPLGSGECFLGLHPFREISGHLSEADQLAGLISQCSDDHIGPESRTVFSYAPAFILESSLFIRNFQLPLRFAVPLILFGIENREMRTDDFPWSVQIYPPSSSIPSANMPCRIEHENCVILNRFHEQLELCFLS